MMVQLWDEGCRNMTSPYLLRPLRSICQTCKERIARDETGLCDRCDENAQADIEEGRQLAAKSIQGLMQRIAVPPAEPQANVVDLTQERAFRHVLKIVERDEG